LFAAGGGRSAARRSFLQAGRIGAAGARAAVFPARRGSIDVASALGLETACTSTSRGPEGV